MGLPVAAFDKYYGIGLHENGNSKLNLSSVQLKCE